MNPDSFCTDYQNPSRQAQESSGRRLSTSWDNETKYVGNPTGGLAVPRVDQRRNSNTLAQLLECHHQLSISQANSFDNEDTRFSRSPSRRSSVGSRRPSVAEMLVEGTIRSGPPSRRASVGSRRPSVAAMLVDSGVTKTTEDCLMLTQTFGTSTTLFFQKNPLVDNLDLRPSPAERGLFNFDNSIKDVPPMKYYGTPRPSIALPPSPRLSTLVHSIPSIEESDGQTTPTLGDLPVRPSIEQRGLPAMKFTPVQLHGQLPPSRGRTLHKQPRADASFDFELDRIIASRRKIVDEEQTRRERENQIRPRIQQNTQLSFHSRPHNFDGRTSGQITGNVMEELRNQMEGGEVDRIVKEKKTTTLSPTGVPKQNLNRRSITVEGSLPELLDRPYIRASPQDGKNNLPDGKSPNKTVTIRIPPDHQQQLPKGHIGYRSATPSSSHNASDRRRENSPSP